MWHIFSANEDAGQPGRQTHCDTNQLLHQNTTLAVPQDEKEEIYEQLSLAIDAVTFKDKPFMLGDFNARV